MGSMRAKGGMGELAVGGLLLLLAAYSVGGVNMTARPHAVERHGAAAHEARAALA